MRKTILILFYSLLLARSYAQVVQDPGYKYDFEVKNLVPVLGNADNLGLYGNTNFNASSGLPAINFTIYKIDIGDMEIPISISYDASGIKYSDIPGCVGMKWKLDAGGSIDRSVNGFADESFLIDNLEWGDSDFLEAKNGNMMNYAEQMNCWMMVNGNYDISRDNYYYNFPGRSGSMYLGKTGQFVFDQDYSKLSLTYEYNFSQFTITDESGNRYVFGENTDESAVLNSGRYIRQATGGQSMGARVSFKLDYIITSSGQQINFYYETYNYEYNQLNNECWNRMLLQQSNEQNCGLRSSSNTFSTTQFMNRVSLLRQISTDNEDINFKYTDNNSLAIWKRQLTGISVVSRQTLDTVKRFSFRYDGDFLAGFDELDSSRNVALRHSFNYDGTNTITPFSKARDMYGYYNGASNSGLFGRDMNHTGYPGSQADRSVNSGAAIGVLNEIVYPTGGKTVFEYENNSDTIAGVFTYGPGLRLKSSKDIDRDNRVYNEKHYYYKGMTTVFADMGYADFQNSNTQGDITMTYYSDNPNQKSTSCFYTNVLIENISGLEKQIVREHFRLFNGLYFKTRPLHIGTDIYYGGDTNHLLQSVRREYRDSIIESVKVLNYKMKKPVFYTGFSPVANDPSFYCDFTVYQGYEPEIVYQPFISELVKETTVNYVAATGDSLVETVDLDYYKIDPYPYLLKSQKTQNSKKEELALEFTYPFNTPGDPLMAQMILNSEYTNVIKQKQSVGNVVMFEKQNIYDAHTLNRFVVKEQKIRNLIKADSQSMLFYKYDQLERLLEFGKKGDVRTSYAWLGNTMQPTAIATNCSDSSFAYTSFEYIGLKIDHHNWTLPLSLSVNPGGVTGKFYFSFTNNSLSKTNLASGKQYIISYWSRNGSYSITGGTIVSTKQGNTYNGWTYTEHEVIAASTTLTLSGVSGDMDELRLYPKGATMSTYAYNHLRGVSTACDASNRLSFYEYDKTNRLAVIRDQDGNIVKTVEYHIQGIQ